MRIKLSTATFLWTFVSLLFFAFTFLYGRFASMSSLPFNLEQLPLTSTEIANSAMIFGLVVLGIGILLAIFLAVNHIVYGIRLIVRRLRKRAYPKNRDKLQSPESKAIEGLRGDVQDLRSDINRLVTTRRISNRTLRR